MHVCHASTDLLQDCDNRTPALWKMVCAKVAPVQCAFQAASVTKLLHTYCKSALLQLHVQEPHVTAHAWQNLVHAPQYLGFQMQPLLVCAVWYGDMYLLDTYQLEVLSRDTANQGGRRHTWTMYSLQTSRSCVCELLVVVRKLEWNMGTMFVCCRYAAVAATCDSSDGLAH